MKIQLLIPLMLLCMAASAADMKELIAQLADEDFEIREKATKALSEYPAEYAEKFLAMSKKHAEFEPEICYRLKVASKSIYFRDVISKSDDWLYLHGKLMLDGRFTSNWIVRIDQANNVRQWVRGFDCFIISWVDNSISGLVQWDMITSIEGADMNNMKVKAGSEYTLNIRRYKKTTDLEQGCIDQDDKEFEEMQVKIRAGWKDPRIVNVFDEDKIITNQWEQYCREHE